MSFEKLSFQKKKKKKNDIYINILFYYHLLIGNLKTGAELICHRYTRLSFPFFIPQIRTWATESSSGCKTANFKCRSIYFSFLGALKFLKFFFLILFRFFNLSDRIALSCHNFCDLFRFYTLVQVHFILH